MKVRIYRICKDNPLPTQANRNDAGWDVYASESIYFHHVGQVRFVPLGIIAEAPEGYHFKLLLRSSMGAKRGFRLANHTGVIDSSFSGENDEIKMIMEYTGETVNGFLGNDATITKGEKIGQLILEKNNEIEWDEQENRDFNKISRGGFGSTGI